MIRRLAQSVFRKPYSIGEPYHHLLVRLDERQRLKHGIAQPARFGLHDIADPGRPETASKILNDVRFPWRDNETQPVCAATNHSLNEVLADGSGPLGATLTTASHRQQFFRES